MTQMPSTTDAKPMETVAITSDSAALDLQAAQDLARQTARDIDADAMLLAWFDARAGKGYPDVECGHADKPPWQVFADARGGNLTIDINNGDYTFIFLRF